MISGQFEIGSRVHNIHNPSRVGEVVAIISEAKLRIRWPDDVSPRTETTVNLRIVNGQDEVLESWQQRFRAGNYDSIENIRIQMTSMYLDPGALGTYHSYSLPGVDHLDYQLLPLIRLLRSPHKGMLIADEVGLGKTIEAMLVWRELQARWRYQRLLVVAPAALQQKWQVEMCEKFNIHAKTVTVSEFYEELSSSTHTGRPLELIVSMQALRGQRGSRKSRRQGEMIAAWKDYLQNYTRAEKLFDLVIIDEAHYARNRDSLTYEALQQLATMSKHVLLLSATPVHTKSENLLTLLSLIDEAQYADHADIELIIEGQKRLTQAAIELQRRDVQRNEAIEILQRLGRRNLFQGSELLQEQISRLRDIDEREVSEEKVRVINSIRTLSPIDEVVTRTLKRDVGERHADRHPHDLTVEPSEIEKDLYRIVFNCIRDVYRERSVQRATMVTILPLRQAASSFIGALRHWMQKYEDDGMEENEEVENEEEKDADVCTPYEEACKRIVKTVRTRYSEDEIYRSDTKYARLGEILNSHRSTKLIVFTYFRGTVSYLAERMTKDGINVVSVTGGQDLDEAIRRFQHGNTQVLLATDVAAEGIDLQFCSVIVNYDLPWNPMVLEQRIGRIDRRGQKAKVLDIYQLIQTGTVEERIYQRVAERLRDSSHVLGVLEPVLSNLVSELPAKLVALRSIDTINDIMANYDHAMSASRLKEIETEVANERDMLQLSTTSDLEHVRSIAAVNRPTTGRDLSRYVESFLLAWKSRYPEESTIRVDRQSDTELIVRLSTRMVVEFERFCDSIRMYQRGNIEAACSELTSLLFDIDRPKNSSKRFIRIDSTSPFIAFIQNVTGQWTQKRTSATFVSVPQKYVNTVPGFYYFGVHNAWLRPQGVVLDNANPRLWRVVVQGKHNGMVLGLEEAESFFVNAIRHGTVDHSVTPSALQRFAQELELFEEGPLFDVWHGESTRVITESRERYLRRERYEIERRKKMDARIANYRLSLAHINPLALQKYEKQYSANKHESEMVLERVRQNIEMNLQEWLLTIGVVEVTE